MKTIIISAFPGTGKTYFYEKYKNSDIKVLDSDSSNFSWIKDKNGNNTTERNPDFPQNYINHIKENIGKVDIIFVSSHDIVRKALKDNNINYINIIPYDSCKDEYLRRYRNRGNSESFISMMDKNWDSFIDSMIKDDTDCLMVFNNEYITDLKYVIERMVSWEL